MSGMCWSGTCKRSVRPEGAGRVRRRGREAGANARPRRRADSQTQGGAQATPTVFGAMMAASASHAIARKKPPDVPGLGRGPPFSFSPPGAVGACGARSSSRRVRGRGPRGLVSRPEGMASSSGVTDANSAADARYARNGARSADRLPLAQPSAARASTATTGLVPRAAFRATLPPERASCTPGRVPLKPAGMRGTPSRPARGSLWWSRPCGSPTRPGEESEVVLVGGGRSTSDRIRPAQATEGPPQVPAARSACRSLNRARRCSSPSGAAHTPNSWKSSCAGGREVGALQRL
jgi:hypothetical protein